MGESGQRASHPAIIDRPEFKSPLRHVAEGSITIGLWALWIYWMLPLGTLFLWLLGYKMVHDVLLAGDSLTQFLQILKNGGIGVLTVLAIQLLWIAYNYQFIFKRKGERRKNGHVPDETYLARHFNVDPGLLEKARQSRRLEVVLTDTGLAITSSSLPDSTSPIPDLSIPSSVDR